VTDANTTAGLAAQPDPQKDRGSKPTPERIAEILQIVRILTRYGLHLVGTIEHRAVWRGFGTIAQFFGTAALSVIIAHIHRGIMRAVALERVLLQRAKRGRDLVILARRVHSARAAPPPAAPQPVPDAPPNAAPPPPDLDPLRDSSPQEETEFLAALPPTLSGPEQPLTLATLPSMAQLEAEVRRRPIGQTIVAICRDLGISPSLCTGSFWNQLFTAIQSYRGNLGHVVLEMRRREKRFDTEQWRHPKLALPEQTREGIRRVLGFFVGETPVDPFRAVAPPGAPVAAVATGPP
jgi:hypothetical protein